MAVSIVSQARKTVRILKDQGRITDEHALQAALIVDLAELYPGLGPRDRFSAITQMRQLLGTLPEPEEHVEHDPAQDFLDSFADE